MQVGDEFVVMVETIITANGKTIENPIIRVTRPQAGFNPRFVYFVDNQTVGQPRHWYVGDGNGNVVVSDIDVVDSTTSTALATALADLLTAAGYLSSTRTGTVNDVPETYNSVIMIRKKTLGTNNQRFLESIPEDDVRYIVASNGNSTYVLQVYRIGQAVSIAYELTGSTTKGTIVSGDTDIYDVLTDVAYDAEAMTFIEQQLVVGTSFVFDEITEDIIEPNWFDKCELYLEY